MSSYSFSHQFYQHWTSAPKPVRAAIVQELTDITTLLQTEIPFEKFVFTTHDLDAHLDDLYCIYDLQQAAATKKQADEQAKLAADELRLQEQDRVNQQAKDKTEAERHQQQQEKAQLAQLSAATGSKDDHSESSNQDTQPDKAPTTINPVKAVTDNISPDSAIHLTLNDTQLNTEHEALFSELESHIDDYLTEQMLQMSENLKSWLRAEVSRQLADKE